MAHRFRPMNLKTRVLLLVLILVFVGIWGFAARMSILLQHDTEKLVAQQLATGVSFVADELDDELRLRVNLLEAMARSIRLGTRVDGVTIQRLLDEQKASSVIFPLGILLTNKDGVIMAGRSSNPAFRPGVSIADHNSIRQVIAQDKPVIGHPVIGRFSKQPRIPIAVPVHDVHGALAGVLRASVANSDPDLFGKLHDAKVGKSGHFLVMSPADGVIVAATDESQIMKPLPPRGTNRTIDRRLYEGFEGAAVIVTPTGVEVLGASRKISATGWILVGNITAKEAFAPIRTFTNRIYIGALLVSLVTAAALYFLLRQQLSPLDKAGTAMRRMTAGIEPFGAIPIKRDDEIGRLVRCFNELVAGRQRAEAEIRDLNNALEDRVEQRNEQLLAAERDISERHRLEEQLRQRTEELALEGRRKDEFLAMLAHELRNPLAPIRTTVAVLKRVDQADPNIAWATGIIERQTQQLSRLVDDLLDVARISRGKVGLRREPLDVVVAVKRACETSRPLIETRRHALTLKLPNEPLYVDGDLVRLTQVIGNLLSNAAKFTNEGGAIEVSAKRVAEEVMIIVRDNGIGIAPQMLGRVFDLFEQVDRTLDRSQGGLGIGLKVVQEIVRMHGGKVEARSAGIGKGSQFAIRLPLLGTAKPVLHEDTASVAQKRGVTRRVLVVDDNLDSVESLSILLKMEGHDVRTARDGRTALQVAADFEPCIVLLDIGLPGMNGYEVARELRAQRQCAHAVLIALTGYGQPEDECRAKAAGFDYHLVKPVDPNALTELVAAEVDSKCRGT